MNPLRRLLLWCSRNRWMAERLPRYRAVRRAVSRFLPGETLEDALAEAQRLQGRGIEGVVTFLGEEVASAIEAGRVAEHYRAALDAIAERALRTQISVKPTHLGLSVGRDVSCRNLEVLARHARERANFVWIDMEGSAHTEVTIALFRELCGEFRNVGLCLQAYLYRTERDLESLREISPGLRLVKGAYAESRDMAFPRKQDVDENYLKLARLLLQRDVIANGLRPAFATHDTRLLARVRRVGEESGVGTSGYEVQMLYGIGREMQLGLARQGHRVRVLISYGSAWFPWYMRRLAERPANLGFLLRSAFTR